MRCTYNAQGDHECRGNAPTREGFVLSPQIATILREANEESVRQTERANTWASKAVLRTRNMSDFDAKARAQLQVGDARHNINWKAHMEASAAADIAIREIPNPAQAAAANKFVTVYNTVGTGGMRSG
jgi:hypothetical protein